MIKLPIFVFCKDHSLLIFSSVEKAIQAVESPEVEGGEYQDVFDAEGRRLSFEVKASSRRNRFLCFRVVQLAPVTLCVLEDMPTGREQFKRLLVEHLGNTSINQSLDRLVELSMESKSYRQEL